MSGTRPPRVVVFETYVAMLAGVADAVAAAKFDVMGATSDRDTALQLITDTQPSVVLAGVDGDFDHIPFFDSVREACPTTKVLVYGPAGLDAVNQAFQAKVDAYVFKTAPLDDLAVALRQLVSKTMFFKTAESGGASVLTEREREILSHAASGKKTAEIATELGVTDQTVKFHLSNVYKKLKVANRAEATKWAVRNGLA
jgi:DNA-binding NarL/FixJ family response regulator